MTAWPPPSGLPHFRSLFDGGWRAALDLDGVVCARCGAIDWTHHQCGTACQFLAPGPRPTLPPPSGLPHFRSIFDLRWHTTAIYPHPERVCAQCGAFDDMHHLPTSCGEFLPPGPRPKAGA